MATQSWQFLLMSVLEQQIAQQLQQDWELQLPDVISEEVILSQLEKRVIYLMDRNPEGFFQLMYRLDVAEHKVTTVLYEEDAAMQIAKLIYQRQLQKIASRKLFKDNDNSADKDLRW
jgi:hypothetical protein